MKEKILEGLRILLVEEEALIAMDIEQLCLEHGAASVETVNSEEKLTPEALDVAEAEAGMLNVDAAILDVKIGEGSTDALAHRLIERRVPFIFATGYSSTEPFFAKFPGVVVVTKPYAGAELIKTLASVVRAPSGDRG